MTSREEVQPVTSSLKKKCEDTWLEINKIQNELNQLPSAGPIRGDDTVTAISQVQLKHLESQVKLLEKKLPQLLSTDPVILRALLLQELEKSATELQQTMEVVQGQTKELEEELTKEKKVLEEHHQIRVTLEKKLEASKEAAKKEKPLGEKSRRLTEKGKNMDQETERLMDVMAKFVQTEFPLPPSPEKLYPKKQSSDASTEVRPLLDVLEELMNRSLDAGYNGYIEINKSIWPPHVDTLLRSGIAQRHPQDVNRIRLTAFHLT